MNNNNHLISRQILLALQDAAKEGGTKQLKVIKKKYNIRDEHLDIEFCNTIKEIAIRTDIINDKLMQYQMTEDNIRRFSSKSEPTPPSA